MATRKRTKKQTLAEFRAWLNGVEELQPDNWAPNAQQWHLIRDKINSISEQKPTIDEAVIQKILENIKPQQMTNNVQPRAIQQIPGIPPVPPPVGGVPPGPVTPPTEAAKTIMPPQQPVDLTKPATPNLDTSDGNYDSGFA